MTYAAMHVGGADPVIEVRDLTKHYGPRGLTFSVPRGAICGFLGPNGAGKTTTLRILMGFARADGTLRLLVEQVAERGATVFFSTHQLPEVEQIADHVVMIKHGRCVVEGEIDAIKQRCRRVRCMIETDAELPAAMAHWRRDGRFLTGFSPDDIGTLSQRLAGSGIKVLESDPATLKEIFIEQMEHA